MKTRVMTMKDYQDGLTHLPTCQACGKGAMVRKFSGSAVPLATCNECGSSVIVTAR